MNLNIKQIYSIIIKLKSYYLLQIIIFALLEDNFIQKIIKRVLYFIN